MIVIFLLTDLLEQIDRFAKIGEGRYTIRNCNKNTYIECTPETKPF